MRTYKKGQWKFERRGLEKGRRGCELRVRGWELRDKGVGNLQKKGDGNLREGGIGTRRQGGWELGEKWLGTWGNGNGIYARREGLESA